MLSAPCEDDGLGRHVDAHRKRLGGEKDLHEAAPKEDLDQLCKQQSNAFSVSVVSCREYRECRECRECRELLWVVVGCCECVCQVSM